MLRTFVNGKIHQLKVTGLQPKYSGSCLICPELLAAAGIEPFEKVEIYSLTSTARIAWEKRWTTYFCYRASSSP